MFIVIWHDNQFNVKQFCRVKSEAKAKQYVAYLLKGNNSDIKVRKWQ